MIEDRIKECTDLLIKAGEAALDIVFPDQVDVGSQIGISCRARRTAKLQAGLLRVSSKSANGCQIAPWTKSGKLDGAQLGVYVEVVSQNLGSQYGLIAIDKGIFNNEGARQAAVFAYSDGCMESQYSIIGRAYGFDGKQQGFFLDAYIGDGSQSALGLAIAESLEGSQTAPIAITTQDLNGHQKGFFCYANRGDYWQFGLLTMRNEGPWWSRITPLIGLSPKAASGIIDKVKSYFSESPQ